jgi:hypothetical protein
VTNVTDSLAPDQAERFRDAVAAGDVAAARASMETMHVVWIPGYPGLPRARQNP